MLKACNYLIEFGIIFLIIFTPIYYGSVQLWAITVIELTILLMLLFWGVEMIIRREFAIVKTPLDIIILSFCAYSIISTLFFSKYTYTSQIGLAQVLCISALYFIVVNHILSTSQLIRLLVVILLVGFILAFLHLAKNATGFFGASTGTMLNVGNHFAGYMVIIIPISVALSFVVKDFGKRVLLIFASAIMAAAMAFSLVAGAMLSFFFSLILIALLFIGTESTRKQAFIFGGIVLCLLLVILWFGYTPILKELLTVTDLKTGSPGVRLSMWKSSFDMFGDNPIVGTGLGTFDYIYPKYRLSDMYGRAVYAHSDWLQILTELGLIGFIIFLVGLVRFFLPHFSFLLKKEKKSVTKRKEKKDCGKGIFSLLSPFLFPLSPWVTGVIVGGFSSCGAGFAHALVEFNFHIPAIATLFTIIAAMTVVATLSHARERSSEHRILLPHWKKVMPAPARIIGFTCLLFAIGYFAISILRPCIADAHYQSGIKLESNLLWDEASGEYQSALRYSPNNGDFLYALGNLYTKRANLTKGIGTQNRWSNLALDAFHKAINLCPTNGDYYLLLGNLHEMLRNTQSADNAYVKTISLDPNNAFYHRIYGTFRLRQGDIQSAISEYKKSLQVYPQDFSEILNECYQAINSEEIQPLGRLFGEKLAKMEEEIEAEKQTNHQSNLPAAQGTAQAGPLNPFQKSDDSLPPFSVSARKTQLFLKIAQGICPSNPESHVILARFLQNKGLHDAAFPEYQQAIKLAPDRIDLWNQLSNLLTQQGKFDDVVDLWQQFLKSHPQNAQAHVHLAEAYVNLNRLDDAILEYKKAATMDDNPSYLITAADLYMRQGKSAEAVNLWQTLIKQKPSAAEAHYRLGVHYENQADWITALEHFQKAIATAPENIQYRLHLAQSYFQKKLFYEAIQEWEGALKLQLNNVSIHLQLAKVYQQIGRQDKAKEHYRNVLKLQPGNMEAHKALFGMEK